METVRLQKKLQLVWIVSLLISRSAIADPEKIHFEKDYYAVLDLTQDASQKQIKHNYRKLAREWHPDVAKGDKKIAEEKFKAIGEAYEVLGDPSKKAKYDSLRSFGTTDRNETTSGANFGGKEWADEILRQVRKNFEESYESSFGPNSESTREFDEYWRTRTRQQWTKMKTSGFHQSYRDALSLTISSTLLMGLIVSFVERHHGVGVLTYPLIATGLATLAQVKLYRPVLGKKLAYGNLKGMFTSVVVGGGSLGCLELLSRLNH